MERRSDSTLPGQWDLVGPHPDMHNSTVTVCCDPSLDPEAVNPPASIPAYQGPS